MSRRDRIAWAAFATTAVVVAMGYARMVWQPVERLLEIVPDDAFYYLQIARHLAAGDGSTFDGVHAATGYHPAWMALLVPLAGGIADPVSLLRATLALALTAHLATALALVALLRRFAPPALALLAATCWMANPFALYLAFHALESSLYAFALVSMTPLRLEALASVSPQEAMAIRRRWLWRVLDATDR